MIIKCNYPVNDPISSTPRTSVSGSQLTWEDIQLRRRCSMSVRTSTPQPTTRRSQCWLILTVYSLWCSLSLDSDTAAADRVRRVWNCTFLDPVISPRSAAVHQEMSGFFLSNWKTWPFLIPTKGAHIFWDPTLYPYSQCVEDYRNIATRRAFKSFYPLTDTLTDTRPRQASDCTTCRLSKCCYIGQKILILCLLCLLQVITLKSSKSVCSRLLTIADFKLSKQQVTSIGRLLTL